MFLNDLFQLVKPEFVRERLEPLERWKGLAVVFLYFQFSWRVKAENLEEIARVGKEPLPPYPIEEIGFEDVCFFSLDFLVIATTADGIAWAVCKKHLSSLLLHLHLWYCVWYINTWFHLICATRIYQWEYDMWQIPRALWGVLWTSFHCWWPSILVTIGL